MSNSTPAPAPPETMMQMISGFWISQALFIAAKLGLADLAAAAGAHAGALYRVLRALASVGVFAENEAGRFAQTPLSETLRSDLPGSLRWFAVSELGQEHFRGWGNLMHAVRTGEIAFDAEYKENVWEYYAKNPEDAAVFNRSMAGLTEMANQAVLAAFDFSGIRRLVDIGGGTGGLLSGILAAYPSMSGVQFDLPHVIAASPQRERIELVGGDFFQSVPAGGDAYILKFIIHDWNDERSITILRNCREAMTEDGRLLLVEMVVPPGNEASWTKFIDLNMLVMTGGMERTEAEFRDLLARAGFRLTRIVPTESMFCVIEAVRA